MARLALAGGCALLGRAGCRSEMYDQPRYKPQAPSSFFEDGTSARPIVFGTVARGSLVNDDYLCQGSTRRQAGRRVSRFPSSKPTSNEAGSDSTSTALPVTGRRVTARA